ncbi:MAG: EAL domain-containing protein, partial [Kiloniellales bacterium]|nr:EAL domain-containing protein [Kiloniellales bacterium]
MSKRNKETLEPSPHFNNALANDAFKGPPRLLFHDCLVSALLQGGHAGTSLAVVAVDGELPADLCAGAISLCAEAEGISFLLLCGADIAGDLEALGDAGFAVGYCFAGEAGVATPDRLLSAAKRALRKAVLQEKPILFEGTALDDGTQGVNPGLSRIDISEVPEESFSLDFQPLFLIEDDKLCGAEVLARLPQAGGARISAEKLFASVERKALARFDSWVFRESLKAANEWHRTGHDHLEVCVNFPLDAFDAPGKAQSLLDEVSASRFPVDRLVLELTEVAPARDLKRVIFELESLRHAGVSLALDDLGRGYSSLSLLQSLPLSRVKLDRSFIDDLDRSPAAQREIGALIELVHSYGLTVLAEGVERDTQCAVLREIGCDLYQGFLISGPLPG